MKLTLLPEVKAQVDEILLPLLEPDKWKAFGLPFAKEPYAIVRMEGLPGTGKTALANYMARRMGRAPIHISFAELIQVQLGESEKKMVETFRLVEETECPTIIIEECDALLWSRDLISDDTIYQLSFMNTMLIEIDKFITRGIPSMLILTTNYPKLLDAAMERRITDVIKLSAPQGKLAERMWKSKLPVSSEWMITSEQLEALAALGATPHQMETAILKICRKAMVNNTQPQFADFGI